MVQDVCYIVCDTSITAGRPLRAQSPRRGKPLSGGMLSHWFNESRLWGSIFAALLAIVADLILIIAEKLLGEPHGKRRKEL